MLSPAAMRVWALLAACWASAVRVHDLDRGADVELTAALLAVRRASGSCWGLLRLSGWLPCTVPLRSIGAETP